MGELTPPLGHEGPHLFELQPRGGRRQQLVGDHDRPFGKIEDVGAGLFDQRGQHPTADVADVGGALPQIGVGDRVEGVGEAVDDLGDGGLDVDLFFPDDRQTCR